MWAQGIHLWAATPLLAEHSCLGAGLAPNLSSHTSSSLLPSLPSAESLTHPGDEAGLPPWAVGFLVLCFLACYKKKGKQLPSVEVGVKSMCRQKTKGLFYFIHSILLRRIFLQNS